MHSPMRSRPGRRAATATAALVWAVAAAATPTAAEACTSCLAAADPEVIRAYHGGVVLLSLLPLGMIGGLVLWLRWRRRADDRAPR